MIPKVLLEVVEALKKSSLKLPVGSGDSRRDSSEAEEKIIAYLQNQKRWDIHSPNIGSGENRSWYDLSIEGLLCDIKVSALKGGNDNTNAKDAIYYLLTGSTDAPRNTDQYFLELAKNLQPDEERDFYYLVVKKPNADDAFFVSLKGIAEIKPAHNNPPFQCNWDKSREPVERSWNDAKEFLLETWAKSISKGVENELKGMPISFPDYFEPLRKKISESEWFEEKNLPVTEK